MTGLTWSSTELISFPFGRETKHSLVQEGQWERGGRFHARPRHCTTLTPPPSWCCLCHRVSHLQKNAAFSYFAHLFIIFCWGSTLFKGHMMSNFSLLWKNCINCYVNVVNWWKLSQYNNYLNPWLLFLLIVLPLWDQITFTVQSCQHKWCI